MQSKISAIILLGLILLVSCESKKEITEQSLLGMWKEIGPSSSKTDESKGILISKMESGLYEEEIVILTNTDENNYSIYSDGCFVRLELNKRKEQTLNYLCLGSESENKINLTGKKLIIGNRIFVKHSQ